MNTIKNAIVTTILLAVGYGVYVVLNQPHPAGNSPFGPGVADEPWVQDGSMAPPGLTDDPSAHPQAQALFQELTPPSTSLREGSSDPAMNGVAAASVGHDSIPDAVASAQTAETVSGSHQSPWPQPAGAYGSFAQPSVPPGAASRAVPDGSAESAADNGADARTGQAPTAVATETAPAESTWQPSAPAATSHYLQQAEAARGQAGMGNSAASPASDPAVGTADPSTISSSSSSSSFAASTAPPGAATLPPSGQSGSSASPIAAATAVPPAAGPADGPPAAAAGDNGFAVTWQSADEKLARGQPAEALFMLSLWYDDPSLTEQQQDQLRHRLDELAGTVIYSAEHHLLAPHTVRDGESLFQIADQYHVPTEFLARVNGIQPPYELQTGESLKVVQGPFHGLIHLQRNEMTVFLGRYYAGRFPLAAGEQMHAEAGEYEVANKSLDPSYRDSQTEAEIPSGHPQNPLGTYWLGLTNASTPLSAGLGIHDVSGSAAPQQGSLRASRQDAQDISAILSIGSRIVIQR